MSSRKITDELIENFKLNLYENEKMDNTIEKYLRDILFFKDWSGGRSIDKTIVLDFKNELCKKYAPRSVNSMLSSLNAMFAFLGWHELKIKTLKIQRQIFTDESKELTRKEYNRLLDAAKASKQYKLFYLIQTIGSTGIRISELQYITCEAVRRGQAMINCKGKLRYVILPSKLCKMLKYYMKQNNIKNGSIFISKRGNPLNRSNIWKMLKSICKAANVSEGKVFPHNFRHLFARTFYSMQKDIVRLADVLGHTSINTTRIYTMETGKIHRIQLQQLGLLKC